MEGGLVKQGFLYLQHQQRFRKKWKKVWGILYGATVTGLARLELYEGSQPPESGRKQECWKFLQLNECVSLSERSTESSPKDTCVFSIETAQRVYLIASEVSEQLNWVRALYSLALPQERRCLERSGSQPLPSEGLQLQKNSLYSTRQEASPGQFAVRVRPTEASSRCGLFGVYILVAESKCLLLLDHQTGTLLYIWPYPYLKRFGSDKTMFSFEAGLRCASGEGNFEFETSFGHQIYQVIKCAIKAGHKKDSSPTGYEQHHDQSAVPRQPARSVYLTVSASFQPPLCPQNKVTTNLTIPDSEYAIPFDKMAQNLLATEFDGLLDLLQKKKPRKPQKFENKSKVPINPVYDEPEVIRVDAWKMQATNTHEMGNEYPYLPGWDDYAVPRSRGKMAGQFAVRVRQTEASSRCGLSGMCILVAESKCLLLLDHQTGTLLYSWPYPYLRRFGRDMTMFSFEAGRRCSSGEGHFDFETSFGRQIFQTIDCAIKVFLNEASSPTGHEQHHEDLSVVPRQPARSVSLTVSASPQPPLCPQNKVTTNPTIPDSKYAIHFNKVAQNLLTKKFGDALGPLASAEKKSRKPQKLENIYDESKVPINPVYDEPEVIRVDAWKMQAVDAHEMGYEYPYLPGWDDYAVPRNGGKKPGSGGQDDEDECDLLTLCDRNTI
ncbi:LOW QUALITY PROTEIN: docking protein 2-like [Mantella aurantiaca]